jgi:hypothetical protein
MHPVHFILLALFSAILCVASFGHVNEPTNWGNVYTQVIGAVLAIIFGFLAVVFMGAAIGSIWALITHNVTDPETLILGAALAPLRVDRGYRILKSYSVALPDGRSYSARFIRTESRAYYASSNQRNRTRVHWRIVEQGYNPYDQYPQSRHFAHGFVFGRLTVAWQRWSVVIRAMNLMLDLEKSTRMAAQDHLPHATKRAFSIPA